MINLEECFKEWNLTPYKIEKFDSYVVLYGEDGNYLIKEKDSSKKELFEFLESIHYPYYLPLISSYQDSYELYPYYDDNTSFLPTKGKELLAAFSLLHMESMYVEDVSEDEIREIYEEIQNKITSVFEYYSKLQDFMEEFSFPRIDYYFLIQNVSMFYQILQKAREYLDLWFSSCDGKIRKAYVLHNPFLSNFRICDQSYFIDYHFCQKDILIYDFVEFYKKEYYHFDMKSFFEWYQVKLSLSESEIYLMNALICIPAIVSFKDKVYANTVSIQKELEYIHDTFQFLSEENKENQETNEEKFKE